jgi:hypothetical protein
MRIAAFDPVGWLLLCGLLGEIKKSKFRSSNSRGRRHEAPENEPERTAGMVPIACDVSQGVPARTGEYAMKQLFAVIALLATTAHSHDAPSGWSYPTQCCGGIDCAPLPDGAVKWTPAGWLVLETGETRPEEEAGTSQDHHFHRCRKVASEPLSPTRKGCLFVPGSGA